MSLRTPHGVVTNRELNNRLLYLKELNKLDKTTYLLRLDSHTRHKMVKTHKLILEACLVFGIQLSESAKLICIQIMQKFKIKLYGYMS